MIVPFLDLSRIHNQIQPELVNQINKIIDSNTYISGTNLSNFEESFAKYCNTKFCAGTSNGLDALTLLLKSHDIGPGDEVIVPAHTFIATWLSVSHTGALPVPVDVNSKNFNINIDNISNKINHKTKAIIAVHLYGQMSNIVEIKSIADKYNLFLFEDAAQAHGASFNGHKPGSLTNGAAFSFYPTKNLGAMGDGGAVVTNSQEIDLKLRKFRNYGSVIKYKSDLLGHNARLDEMQAAILNIKLSHLSTWNDDKNNTAKRYLTEIINSKIVLPYIEADAKHSWHLFVIKTEKRDYLQKYLSSNNISTIIHYPVPPHKQECYSHLSYSCNDTEKLCDQVLSIPLFPHMKSNEIDHVINTLNSFK